MKIFSDVRVAHHLGIGLLVAAATFGFATSAQARVLLGSPGPAPLSTGLVGYWPLDGAVTNWRTNTTADIPGNGNTGWLVSLATTTAPIAGRIGQAMKFNGSSDYVVDSLVVNIPKTTVSAWVKVTRYPAAKAIVAGFIRSLGDTTCDKDLVIGSDGKLYFYVFDGIARTTSAPSSAVPLNTWVHVVGTADGNAAHAYVNGVEVGSTPAGNTYTSYSGGIPNIFISGVSGSAACGTSYLNGSIDDVRIYKPRALGR